jgi:hypothetical protein
MKAKTQKLIEDLRRLLLQTDGIRYSDDTLIQISLEKEIKRIKEEK